MKKIIAVFMAVIILACGMSVTAFAAGNPIHNFMTNTAVLGFRYNEDGKYYYTDKDDSWQARFGYSALYDLAAPYIDLEYDYVRVHFTYEGKDWMIQLWKGQYGEAFFGSEVGIYTKPANNRQDSILTFYDCASESDRLVMQSTLSRFYNGVEKHEFTTPKEATWWSTGFKAGHLIKVEPADELKQTASIDFKSEEMARAFADGLLACGFTETDEGIEDSFFVNGKNVSYVWRNISEAENTMPVKIAGAALAISSFLSLAILFTTMLPVIIRFMAPLFV